MTDKEREAALDMWIMLSNSKIFDGRKLGTIAHSWYPPKKFSLKDSLILNPNLITRDTH